MALQPLLSTLMTLLYMSFNSVYLGRCEKPFFTDASCGVNSSLRRRPSDCPDENPGATWGGRSARSTRLQVSETCTDVLESVPGSPRVGFMKTLSPCSSLTRDEKEAPGT